MPLIHSKSNKAFEKNVKTEMDAHPGKDRRAQNLAIAYSIKRRAKKMAKGGHIEEDKHEEPTHEEHEMKSKRERAMEAFHNMKKMAEGGQITDNYQPEHSRSQDGEVNDQADALEQEQHYHVNPNHSAMSEDERKLNQHGEDEQGPNSAYAEGGQITDNYQEPINDDMVDRIMAHRQLQFSEGGKIANEDQGLSSQDLDKMADGQPNEIDDLALRDDLEFSYDGKNSGDELGNEREDEDREDMVSRIMKSRAKKDKLPNPR